MDLEEASTFALMDYERSQGLALLCSAYPLSDVTIELADDYQEADLRSGVPIQDLTAHLAVAAALTRDLWWRRSELTAPSRLEFRAKQYVEMQLPGTSAWRAYSMANAPKASDRIEAIVKILPAANSQSTWSTRSRRGTSSPCVDPTGSSR